MLCIKKFSERTDGWMNGLTDQRPRSNMPLQLLQSWGHNNTSGGRGGGRVVHIRTFCSFSNKRTMMVLYPSPEQTDLHTSYLSFSQVLDRGSPKEHFCQVILKSVQWFLTRRFLKFSILIYRENKPCPLAAMFFDESLLLEQSW